MGTLTLTLLACAVLQPEDDPALVDELGDLDGVWTGTVQDTSSLGDTWAVKELTLTVDGDSGDVVWFLETVDPEVEVLEQQIDCTSEVTRPGYWRWRDCFYQDWLDDEPKYDEAVAIDEVQWDEVAVDGDVLLMGGWVVSR